VLNGTAAAAASHAQTANGHGSSTKRRLLQEALLPEIASDNQPLSNKSSALTCLGWNSTQCPTNSIDKPAFALLGDSITHLGFKTDGWARLLEAAYGGAVKAVNYGIPGANSSQGDVLLDKLLEQFGAQLQQVKLVTVCFGANDAVKSHITSKHLPVPKFKANLQRLVSRLQEKGISRIVLATPPPVGQRNDRHNTITANYATAVTELAKELKLESVDVYSAIMAVDQWQVSKGVRHSPH
jgi:lysophospholipase L1-like esterase